MIKTILKSQVQGESGTTHTIVLMRFVSKTGIIQYRVMLGKVLIEAYPDLKSAKAKYEEAIKIAERE